MSLNEVWSDAWELYKLLFRRSVLVAALVYAVIDASDVAESVSSGRNEVFFGLIGGVLSIAGTVLVQGALVEIVRNIHDATKPESVLTVLARAAERIGSLVWASIVYGLGVSLGLLALIVPGLLAASRWSLMAPLIMLEDRTAGDARRRSNELVKGQTGPVLWIVVATFVATAFVSVLIVQLVSAWSNDAGIDYVLTVVGSALTAPFLAHVLTVVYYRLTDPDHPVIHPDVHLWRSVWAGA